MIKLLFLATMSLGLSESIERRLPEDPGMIYTVGFPYNGVKVGLAWQDRALLPSHICLKSAPDQRPACQAAAASWLHAECGYYNAKKRLTKPQKDMRKAVCQGAKAMDELLENQQVARR
ncbi:MAG: hypothetical protein AAF993_14490 [Pseudomonadota bacterium]